MIMVRKFCREGFTLIELSISLLFIGILSIVIVLIISNTVEAYRRGLTLTQLNSTGMNLVDDMRTAVQNSTAKSLDSSCVVSTDSGTAMSQRERNECLSDSAYNFVTLTKTERVRIESTGETIEVPIYGTFCTGTYSYIWNSGYFEMSEATFDAKTNRNWAKLIYNDENGHEVRTFWSSEKPFKLLKVEDGSRAVCMAAINANGGQYRVGLSGINNVIDITQFGLTQEEPVDLFADNASGSLALYDLSVARPAESGEMNNMFYSVSFILGTVTGGINIKANGNTCSPPNDYESENFDYCAINKFNFAVQVNGG